MSLSLGSSLFVPILQVGIIQIQSLEEEGVVPGSVWWALAFV